MSRSDRTETRCGVTRVRCEGQPFESMLEERSLFTCGRNTINTQVPSDTVRRERAPPRGRGRGAAPGGRRRGSRSGACGLVRVRSGSGGLGGRAVRRSPARRGPAVPVGSLRSGRTQQDRPGPLETSRRGPRRETGCAASSIFYHNSCVESCHSTSDVSYYTGTRHGGLVQSYEISRSAQVTPHRCRAPRALRSRLEAKRPKSVRSMPFF